MLGFRSDPLVDGALSGLDKRHLEWRGAGPPGDSWFIGDQGVEGSCERRAS
jgi:hypothetical protein